jgi:phytoene synthase
MQPNWSRDASASAEDFAAADAAIRTGSRSFFAASMVLPRRVRQPARALYAFCREADDAVDRGDDLNRALDHLHERLNRIYRGRPADIAADRAFADVVAAHAIPQTLPEALLDGFAWDAEGRRYDTVGELRAYGARVAGAVGAMVTMLMGARDPQVVARATDLGVAMQLTNIARDVGEDARQGRLYLPTQWLEAEGVDPDAWLADPQFTPGVARTVARLLDHAEELYRRAEAGIPALPVRCRPGLTAASRLYREIGREVARRGHDSLSQRAVVPTMRKVGLMLDALTGPAPQAHFSAYPCLPETRYLVDAVHDAVPALHGYRPDPADDLVTASEGPASFVIDLLIRLEQRDQIRTQAERG